MPLLDIFSLEQLPTIPYTQIQNVTADRILGRLSTSGSIQELTAAQVRTLINVSDGANAYTLPTATSTVLGGVELFSDTVQTVAANAVTTTASRTYGIQLNSSGQMVVNVPWSDTNTVYTHPAYTARSIDTTGAQVIDVFTSDAIGSVTNITTRTMTLADLGYTGATNADNYGSWLIAASGTAGTGTVASGNTVTLSAGTGMTVTRSTNTVTFATTITQYTDALARASISLTTTGNSGAATYSSATGVFNIPNYTLAGLGGLANPMTTLGDTIYGGASGIATRLAGNTTTTKQYLSQTGTGTVSAAPTWSTIAGSDVTGAALTSTNDTNVTVTLGGTPSTALLRAASITLGWTGQLAIARGGTGLSALGTANQLLRVNAGATALEYFTPTYLTGNQTITLSGVVTGSGTTAITTSIANGAITNAMLANSSFNIGTTSITLGRASASQTLTGVSIDGTSSGVVRTVTGTTTAELVRGNMADNDQFRILVGGTASNAGYVEIATADDGTEPIYVRQYTGTFTTLTRTATLLDGSGNTSFPGTLTANSIVKSGGTSSQFLKADGSVDSNSYYLASNPNGYTSNAGTVTSVSGTGGYGGLTLSGTVTSSGNITLGGTPTGTWPISISGISAAVESGAITDLNAAWTLPGTSIPNRFYVYRYSNNATGSPENYDNANWLINIYSHPAGGTASYGHQLAAPDLEKIYFRRVIDGSFGPWRQFLHTGNGNLQIITDVGSTTTNSITAANFITSSDKRLKSEIKEIKDAINTLSKFTSYEYIKDGRQDAGFIAQEVKEVLPYCVFDIGNDAPLTMSDRPILAYIHKAILELNERISKLEK